MSAATTSTDVACLVGGSDVLTDRLNNAVRVRHEIEGRLLLDPDSRTIRAEHAAAGTEVAEARRALRQASGRPWWTRAANPTCRPWCEDEHYDGEFAEGGAITCRKVLDEDDWFSVYVLQTISVDADETPGVVEVTDSAVYHWLHNDEWTADQAERYARALLAAVAFARTDNPR